MAMRPAMGRIASSYGANSAEEAHVAIERLTIKFLNYIISTEFMCESSALRLPAGRGDPAQG